MVPIQQFYKDLPQNEKILLSSCAPLMEDGDELALSMLQTAYTETAETSRLAARLYFGASIREPLALLTLGRYHLHGYSVFPRDNAFAGHCLSLAAESKNKLVAEAAKKELAVMAAPLNVFKLYYYTLEEYLSHDKSVVVIPPFVREIGDNAFVGHAEIEEIILPFSLTAIGRNAFAGCSSLKAVHFPKSLRQIGYKAFINCASLKEVSFPDDLISLGEYAFCNSTSLEKVRLPRNLAMVSDSAFYKSGVKEVTLGKNTAQIGRWAFYDTPLEQLYFSDALQLVDAHAFSGCKNLARLYCIVSMYPRSGDEMVVKGDNDPFKREWISYSYCDASANLVWTKTHDEEPEIEEWEKLEGMPSRREEQGYWTDSGSGFSGPLIWLP